MMKFCFTTFIFSFLFSSLCIGQFADDFEDGNLDGWEGNVDHFMINSSGQLQLNAPVGSGNSWIHTPVTFGDSMKWEIYIRLLFAPSTSNQLKIYLGLTSADIATASGYYLEIGATGDMDAIDLKYLNAGAGQIISSSPPGIVGTDPVDIRLSVTRNAVGEWQVMQIGIPFPELLISATHDLLPLPALSVFGLDARYTDTRRDKFIFDDILISPLVADLLAPVWDNLEIIDNQNILLTFSEALDPASVTPGQFILQPGSLQPDQIDLQNHQVTLHFPSPFIDQQSYMLTVQGITDTGGNVMVPTTKEFAFIAPQIASAYEILITEIMADPTPVIGLPDAEYIELFNNSNKTFELSEYILVVGTGTRDLPAYTFAPGTYIIITDDANEAALSSFGNVLALGSMPGLTNSGTTIQIKIESGEIIHDVAYDVGWYHDPVRSDGGWSLEMINPKNVCSTIENWAASTNLTGGTPGSVNSQWSVADDIAGPELLSFFTSGASIIQLRFNEKLDDILSTDIGLFAFIPALSVSDVMLLNPTTIQIQLQENLEEGVIYTLLPLQVFDCIGNVSALTDTLTFGITAVAEAGDLLIHEILFNPGTGGSRFIEIINVSNKFIDLSTIAIGRITDDPVIYPTEVQEIITPGEIVAFTPERDDILSRYTVPQPQKLFDASLPSWDEDTDHVAILAGGVVIDSFTYSADWHHPVISDQNGVSLERISTNAPTSSSSTWHSASSLAGYATPTGPNSQSTPSASFEGPFSLVNKNFSPNDDGFKDFLGIQFELEGGNDVGSVWVYDLEGREIYQILSNENLGTSAFIQWDGRNAEGLLSDMGIYIIFIQLWDINGNVREFQETCALVKR